MNEQKNHPSQGNSQAPGGPSFVWQPQPTLNAQQPAWNRWGVPSPIQAPTPHSHGYGNNAFGGGGGEQYNFAGGSSSAFGGSQQHNHPHAPPSRASSLDHLLRQIPLTFEQQHQLSQLCQQYHQIDALVVLQSMAPHPIRNEFPGAEKNCLTRRTKADPDRFYISQDGQRKYLAESRNADFSFSFRPKSTTKPGSNYYQAFPDANKLKLFSSKYDAARCHRDINGILHDMATVLDPTGDYRILDKASGKYISWNNFNGEEMKQVMFNPERYGLQVSYAFEKRAQILDKWNDEGCPPPPPSQQAPYHPPPTPPPFGPNPNNVVPPSPIAPSSVVHPSAPSDQEQTIDLKDWVKLATRNAECIAGNAECIAGNATATANLADGLSKVTDGLSKVKVVVNDVADGLQKVTNEVSHLWHHKNEGIARMNGFEDQVAALTSEFRQLAHLKQNGGNTPLTAPSVASESSNASNTGAAAAPPSASGVQPTTTSSTAPSTPASIPGKSTVASESSNASNTGAAAAPPSASGAQPTTTSAPSTPASIPTESTFNPPTFTFSNGAAPPKQSEKKKMPKRMADRQSEFKSTTKNQVKVGASASTSRKRASQRRRSGLRSSQANVPMTKAYVEGKKECPIMVPLYSKGMKVLYTKDGVQSVVEIKKVHFDDHMFPFYTIDGDKQTVNAKLSVIPEGEED